MTRYRTVAKVVKFVKNVGVIIWAAIYSANSVQNVHGLTSLTHHQLNFVSIKSTMLWILRRLGRKNWLSLVMSNINYLQLKNLAWCDIWYGFLLSNLMRSMLKDTNYVDHVSLPVSCRSKKFNITFKSSSSMPWKTMIHVGIRMTVI